MESTELVHKRSDIVVIGGGPSGMMAAGRAAELGARVTLVEKNSRLGRKLLICGKGRCNIVNAAFELRALVEQYGRSGKFLYSGLSRFGAQDVIEFFETRGVKTKIERGNRVFPVSDKSTDVLRAMETYMRGGGVEVLKNTTVRSFVTADNRIEKAITDRGEILSENYVIATGGKSFPATGSTGDGYAWLKRMGHNIHPPRPSLAPIVVKEKWIKDLEGLSLKNVNIAVVQNGKKRDERFGEALFTDNGMSGPIVLDVSKTVGELLSQGEVELRIDFKPALDREKLDKRVRRDFEESGNKMFRNSLNRLLPLKLIPVIVKLSGIDPDKRVHGITREERKRLTDLLKGFTLHAHSIDGFSKAIVTAGGVDLKEVDPRTMKSKVVENLYLTGEILDLDGPTGGFNLQVAWTTGYMAGDSLGG